MKRTLLLAAALTVALGACSGGDSGAESGSAAASASTDGAPAPSAPASAAGTAADQSSAPQQTGGEPQQLHPQPPPPMESRGSAEGYAKCMSRAQAAHGEDERALLARTCARMKPR